MRTIRVSPALRAKPVRRYRALAYPTRLEVLADPDLLKKNLPPGWLKPELAGVVAILLTANACVNNHSPGEPGAPTTPPPPLLESQAAVVAPIFEHGDGLGVIGCVAVAPPVFLSEEEALQIITEELHRAGIETAHRDVELAGVTTVEREVNYSTEGGDWHEEIRDIPGTETPFSADILDEQHQIAVEYVSASDYRELGGPQSTSTVQGFDFRQVAEDVADRVRTEGHGVYFGAFYDPAANVDRADLAWWENARTRGRAEAERLLRLQVQDFIEWLQGQGVI